ncbi:MAG: hypothetical protein ACE5J4_01010 [Candidatus Aenigmatarchaeota archaeon]
MKKLLTMLLVVVISGCIASTTNYVMINPYTVKFANVTLHFRSNLNEAKKIPVYPNEQALKDVLLDQYVRKIGIAYISNESENPFYYVTSYELAYKLTIINKYYFRKAKPVSSYSINNTEEPYNVSVRHIPIILLLGPSHANQTAITVKDYVITVEGLSFEEIDRKYTDLDLAADKLLLTLME